MDRRTFVGLLCGAVPVVSGCSTPGQVRNGGGQRQAIEDRQFDLVDPDDRFDPDAGWNERFQHGADVRFTAATERVVVTGRVNSGGRSCRDTVLDSARYDGESDTLTVVILDTFDESSTGCTTELAVIPYEATITFDTSFPKQTVVKHRSERSGIEYSETFTRN